MPGVTVRAAAVVLVAGMVAAGCGGGGAADPPGARGVPRGAGQAEFGRNVVRVPGRSAADVAGAAVLAAYAGARPSGWLLVPSGAWREQAVAAQFAAGRTGAAVLAIERDHLPAATTDVAGRLELAGFRRTPKLQGLVLGDVTSDLFADARRHDLEHLSRLQAPGAAALAAEAIPFAGGFSGSYSKSVAIVSSRAPAYAAPAAAWSAFSGDTVAFVDGARVPAATRRLLEQRRGLTLVRPSIYLVGPPSVIPAQTARALRAYGRVRRIPGRTPAEVAVALARYRDPATGFGWGARRGPSSVVLMHERHLSDLPAALALAARGPRAPLLLAERRDRLPVPVLAYLRQLRGRRPSQAFALGDRARFTTRALARLDALLEPEARRAR
jgi:hypothetical protein